MGAASRHPALLAPANCWADLAWPEEKDLSGKWPRERSTLTTSYRGSSKCEEAALGKQSK